LLGHVVLCDTGLIQRSSALEGGFLEGRGADVAGCEGQVDPLLVGVEAGLVGVVG
jgi:hypothetical protein